MTYHQINNLHNVTAFIYIDNDFIGCAVIFKNNDEIMLATAFHVVKPLFNDFEKNKNSITIKDEKKRQFTVVKFIGDVTECKKKDIALMVLDGDIKDLKEISFLNPLNDPSLQVIARCKSKDIYEPGVLYSKEQIERYDDLFYYITVDKSILEDSSGRWGADALQGISGSGVFIKTHQNLIFVGVISSIPNEGMLAKIKCCNASSFTEVHNSLKTYDTLSYNFGNDIIKESTALLKEDNFESVMHDWENSPENKKFNDNINRKIKVLHVPDKITNEKKKILYNLLSGDDFAKDRINNHPNIESSYFRAHQIFCGEDMTIYENSRIEANRRYSKIKEEYFNTLSESLKPLGLKHDEVLLLRNKDIAFWLANCDLDFLDGQ